MPDRPESTPASWRMRPARRDDRAAVLRCVAACQEAEYGNADPAMVATIASAWNSPDFDPSADAWLALDADGHLLGCAQTAGTDPPDMGAFCFIHPLESTPEVAIALLPHLEARVRERLAAHPGPQPATLTWWIAATNAPARQAAAAAGYDEVRHMWAMLVELGDDPPAEPRWPAGIAVRPCATDADRRAAHAAVEDAFRDHWGHTPRTYEQFAREWIYADGYDPALWFLALDEASGAVAGTAICEGMADRGWVGDLAVRRPWRGRGLGMALLCHAFCAFHARGQRRVGLGIDAQSLTGATRLYERAGMRVERQYDVFQKSLGAGGF